MFCEMFYKMNGFIYYIDDAYNLLGIDKMHDNGLGNGGMEHMYV